MWLTPRRFSYKTLFLPCHSPLLLFEFSEQSDEYSLDVDDVGAIASSNSQVSGYGFASFCYVTGSVILFIAALYSSPLLCGTVNERRMLKSPTEIHSTDHIEGHNFEKQAPADENA
jgi:hypothetical protein